MRTLVSFLFPPFNCSRSRFINPSKTKRIMGGCRYIQRQPDSTPREGGTVSAGRREVTWLGLLFRASLVGNLEMLLGVLSGWCFCCSDSFWGRACLKLRKCVWLWVCFWVFGKAFRMQECPRALEPCGRRESCEKAGAVKRE